jgi:hypothetical protein
MLRQQMEVIVGIGRRRLRKSETRHFECGHGRKAQDLEAVRDNETYPMQTTPSVRNVDNSRVGAIQEA